MIARFLRPPAVFAALMGLLAFVLFLQYAWPGGAWTRDYGTVHDAVIDEGTVLYDSYRISRGEVMYRDFFEFQGPIFYYLNGLVFWVFGKSLAAARVVNALVVGGGAALLATLTVPLAGRTVAAMFVLLYGTTVVPMFPLVYPSWLAQTLALAGLVFVTRPDRKPRHEVMAGMMFAASMATIQSLGIPMLAAALGTPVIVAALKHDLIAGLRIMGRMLAGVAGVLAVLAAWFAAHDALSDFFTCTVVWLFGHYGHGQADAAEYAAYADDFVSWLRYAPQPWRALATLAIRTVEFLPPFGAAGAIAAVVIELRGARREKVLTLALASLAALTPLVAGGGRHDIIHVAFVATFGLLGVALAFPLLDRAPRAARTFIVACSVVAFLLTTTFLHKMAINWKASRAKKSFAAAYRTELPLLTLIEKHTRPGDLMVAGWLGGWYYWFSDREAATRFTYMSEPTPAMAGYFTDDMWKQLGDEVLRRQPAVMYLRNGQFPALTKARPELGKQYASKLNAHLVWRNPGPR